MGIEFGIRKPDGEIESDISMGYSGLSSVIDVGKKAGIDMSEYSRILDYDDEEKVIEYEDIKKLLVFCRDMQEILLEQEKTGKTLLSKHEELKYKTMKESGLKYIPPKNTFAGTIPRLHALIELCEKALAANSSIIMIP